VRTLGCDITEQGPPGKKSTLATIGKRGQCVGDEHEEDDRGKEEKDYEGGKEEPIPLLTQD